MLCLPPGPLDLCCCFCFNSLPLPLPLSLSHGSFSHGHIGRPGLLKWTLGSSRLTISAFPVHSTLLDILLDYCNNLISAWNTDKTSSGSTGRCCKGCDKIVEGWVHQTHPEVTALASGWHAHSASTSFNCLPLCQRKRHGHSTCLTFSKCTPPLALFDRSQILSWWPPNGGW